MITINKVSNYVNAVKIPVAIKKHGEGQNDLYGYYFFLCATKSDWLSDYDKRMIERFENENGGLKAMLVIDDNRTISAKQRKLANSLLTMICNFHGYDRFTCKELREWFKIDYLKTTKSKWFSLSDCSVTEANNYIAYLIYQSVEMGLELPIGMIKDEFSTKFIHACLMTRTCCVTGKKITVQIHHSNKKVGMGRNRKKIDHTDFELLPLVAELHHEAHTIGDEAFKQKYLVYGIKLSQQDLVKLGINKNWKDKLDEGEDYGD